MARIRCFLLEPTGNVRVSLRRFRSMDAAEESPCPVFPGKYSYHTARNPVGEEPGERDAEGYLCNGLKEAPAHDDPRWPRECACGYQFQEEDHFQRFTEEIYCRVEDGEEMTLHDAPAGAMWRYPYGDLFHVPQDEHTLVVKTPGGEWEIDGQANNCTMPEDGRQEKHHCWVRHGVPPDITVDKDGPTCSAGAGSIQCGSYHGFLRNGYLED